MQGAPVVGAVQPVTATMGRTKLPTTFMILAMMEGT